MYDFIVKFSIEKLPSVAGGMPLQPPDFRDRNTTVKGDSVFVLKISPHMTGAS